MKAILVTVSLTTRIVVDDEFNIDELRDEDYNTIRQKAYPRLIDALHTNGVGDSITEIDDDTVIPFGESVEDKNEI